MPSRHSHNAASLAAQTTQLALAVPQVVAHRLGRMALAGPQPSARDRREFSRMGLEKTEAFFESWMAMGAQAWRLQLDFWVSLWGAGMSPLFGRGSRRGLDQALDAQRATVAILGSGLAPVRRRAVANAKRLARVR
jgi:hypothetical protein